MKLNTNRIKFLHLSIYIISFTSVISLSFAQTFNPNLRIEYENNLITISAQNADLKNVLLKLADKTGISVKFPNSLEKQITIKISAHSLNEALSRILKGLNHVIIYSGLRKNRNIVSEVLVYKMSKRSRISGPREKQMASRRRHYERRLESLKKKLSLVDENSRQGKRYLRQIRSYENIIEKYKRKTR